MGCRDHVISVKDAGAAEVEQKSVVKIVLDWNHEGVVVSWGSGPVNDSGFLPSQYWFFDWIIQRVKNRIAAEDLDLAQKK